jgi:hypothetical protein
VSTNPWKVTATFQTISSTREEYVATIESLKASSSTGKGGEKKSKTEANHLELIKLLEDRLEKIDLELAVSPNLFIAATIIPQFRVEKILYGPRIEIALYTDMSFNSACRRFVGGLNSAPHSMHKLKSAKPGREDKLRDRITYTKM